MKSSHLFIITLATGIMIVSCKKDKVSPSGSSLSVKLQATNKTFSLQNSLSAVSPRFTGDTCFMNVSRIEVEAEKRENEGSFDSSKVHLEWDGPQKVDLFNLNSVIGDINLQPGVYDEVKLKIKALKADANNSPVFYLSGTFSDSINSILPIIVIVNEDFEFEIKKEGFTMNAVNDYTSLINVDLNLLMSGILKSDIGSAVQTNGKVIISSTSNIALYNKILTNLSSCEESEFEQGKGSGDNSESEHGNGSGSDGSGNRHGGSGSYY